MNLFTGNQIEFIIIYVFFTFELLILFNQELQ